MYYLLHGERVAADEGVGQERDAKRVEDDARHSAALRIKRVLPHLPTVYATHVISIISINFKSKWKGLWGVECILAVIGTGGP
eukprot:1056216-Prorocentrum_minimum.AAC.1